MKKKIQRHDQIQLVDLEIEIVIILIKMLTLQKTSN